MTYKNIKGITLTEILIALLILATAFIPIIGVMSGGIKGTQKDETVLKAVQLSQQALSTALQIPFNDLVANKGAGGGPWTFGTADSTFDYATGSLNLRLGKVTVGNIDHTLTLTIDDVPFVFTLDTHDPMARNLGTAHRHTGRFISSLHINQHVDRKGSHRRQPENLSAYFIQSQTSRTLKGDTGRAKT